MVKLNITMIKSGIGYSQDQKDTLRSLGLKKISQSVIHEDNPSIRGMILKVRHLVRIGEAN
ncbi:MAG: 50S ribosomal protein L30 [Chloroflexi bacterium]|nr:50S ribosomal protein L30 [Chloroflexota bacterium]